MTTAALAALPLLLRPLVALLLLLEALGLDRAPPKATHHLMRPPRARYHLLAVDHPQLPPLLLRPLMWSLTADLVPRDCMDNEDVEDNAEEIEFAWEEPKETAGDARDEDGEDERDARGRS